MRPRPDRLRRQTSFRPAVEGLEARDVPTVLYYGGNVLPHVNAQALYYGNEWSSSTYQPLTTKADSFLADVTGGAYMTALTNAGYGVGTGTDTPGKVDNAALATGTTITDASIRSRIVTDINAGLLRAPTANSLYVVYVEPNVAVNLGSGQGTTQQGILGYHGAFGLTNGSTVRYAVIAYPGGSVGNSSLGTAPFDQMTAVTSHELAEAVTDPDVNYKTLGWYDPQKGEIGDITENNPAALVRLDGYLVQEVAGKNDQLLSLFASPPPVSPPPPASPPPATTPAATTTTLSAGPVRYFGSYATSKLTVTIRTAGSTVPAGGTVELIYNGQVLGTATVQLVNGVATATFNVTYYANGNYTFTAQYMGTSQYAASTSNSTTVVV